MEEKKEATDSLETLLEPARSVLKSIYDPNVKSQFQGPGGGVMASLQGRWYDLQSSIKSYDGTDSTQVLKNIGLMFETVAKVAVYYVANEDKKQP